MVDTNAAMGGHATMFTTASRQRVVAGASDTGTTQRVERAPAKRSNSILSEGCSSRLRQQE